LGFKKYSFETKFGKMTTLYFLGDFSRLVGSKRCHVFRKPPNSKQLLNEQSQSFAIFRILDKILALPKIYKVKASPS